MKYSKEPSLKGFSQRLRREMTKEERRLWYDFLKLLPLTVNRQKVIGKYIVDFYCSEAKLVIELDGSQHYFPKGMLKDSERDAYLTGLGLTVLRYGNLQVKRSFKEVCEDIFSHLPYMPELDPNNRRSDNNDVK